MIPFNLKQLETFLLVAGLGSFRKAAERLNTTQPAVSTRIASLESALGTKLFERGSIVQLTAEGQKLLTPVQQVLRVAEKLQVTANTLGDATGVLRIGVAETIAHTWLLTFLKQLRLEFPRVLPDIVVDSSPTLRNELLEHRVDIALLVGPVLEFAIGNIELNSTPLIWAASPKLDLPVGRPVSICELAQFPLITSPRTTRPYAEIYRKLNGESEQLPRIFPVNGFAAAMRMALDGIGIASLPAELIRRYLPDGQLRTVECEWHPSAMEFTVSYPVMSPNPMVERAAQMAADAARGYDEMTAGGGFVKS